MKLTSPITFCFLSLVLCFLGQVNGQSLGTAFTYQGQLQDEGQPANGIYNFNFRVFSAETGGIQVGPSMSFNNRPVTDGLFTVELDFTPAAYNNNTTPGKRWLQVAVDGTVLSPRQPLTGAPYSIQTRGLDVLEDGGLMSVGVGRTGFDTFNVFTETTGFGGMTVETETTGSPRYGYKSGDNISVYHYLDYDSQSWRLSHGGEDRITVLNNGFVGIGRDYQIGGDVEVFGLYKDTSGSEFGGMRVETNVNGKPMYGYEAGNERSYTYLDSAAKTWYLHHRSANRISVGQNGNVGIGVSAPAWKLQVEGEAAKPGGGSWTTSSDRRLKKNIRDLDGSLEKLLKLRGVTFEYNDPKSINELEGERVGVIAQDVEKVFPDWVTKRNDGYKAVTFRGFEALTVEALRELRHEKNTQIETLERMNDELHEENNELRDRMETLEQQVQQLFATMQTQQR